MTTPHAAGVYCRISSDRTGEALGVERQETLCRDLAERKGWPVAEVYIDNDLGAYAGKPRPAYDRMLDDLRAGTRDAVIVVDQDRLTRQTKELEGFIDLAEALGVSLATVSGDVDLSTSDGRFRARIMGAVARQESEKKSERIQRERAQRASKGIPHPGPRAFGFRDGNVEHDPSEARLIRAAARRVLAGESLRGIANEWNDKGVRTARRNRWSVNSLRDVLTSPRVAGYREHQGEVVGDGAWKPIVERDTWERLVAMTKRRRRPGRPAKRPLSGLLVCGLCGSPMVAWMDHGKRHYRCQRQPSREQQDPCGRISIVGAPCEEWLRDAVIHRLAGGNLADLLAAEGGRADDSEALAVIEVASGRLEALADDYADGKVSRAMFLRTSQRFEEKIADARASLASNGHATVLSGLPTDEDGLRAWWEEAPDSQVRAVLRAVLEAVKVSPADPAGPRRFQPDRLDPSWRV